MVQSSTRFLTVKNLFIASGALRIVLLVFGLVQDRFANLPYTDIDYYVFTDAARYVSNGDSPYARETYRYTPLLAWLLLPTAWTPQSVWFSYGKVLFILADLITGWFTFRLLSLRLGNDPGLTTERAVKYAAVWLLNPMVATISTRGSSEGLLGIIVIPLLWSVLNQRIYLAGFLLGFGVHFKIYPFIYATALFWHLETSSRSVDSKPTMGQRVFLFLNRSRITLTLISLTTFLSLNAIMYILYGQPFLQETFYHHLTRIDHRHNFSPYNTLLHHSSAEAAKAAMSSAVVPITTKTTTGFESLAFIPQLLLTTILIPIVLAKADLAGTMLCQTFAFVTFNKVITSQYFLWYILLLPFYLPYSTFIASPRVGVAALLAWIATQAAWLHQAYQLEFLGRNTFYPGLWLCSLAFFAVNCAILAVMFMDVGGRRKKGSKVEDQKKDN